MINLTLPKWEQDVSTLGQMRVGSNDCLSVVDGELILEKGSETQEDDYLITISDPKDIADRINQLIVFGQEHFSKIKPGLDSLLAEIRKKEGADKADELYNELYAEFIRKKVFPDETNELYSEFIREKEFAVKTNEVYSEAIRKRVFAHKTNELYSEFIRFQRNIKVLSRQLEGLEFTREIFPDPEFALNYINLYERATFLKLLLKAYKKRFNSSFKEKLPSPQKLINYDERTELSSIKFYHPKNVSIEETVKAAKKALELSKTTPKCCKAVSSTLFNVVLLASATALTPLKILLVNPYELLKQGEVRTRTPLKFAVDFLKPVNTHTRAYQKYSEQILRQPIIDLDAVIAFIKLSGKVDCLDLNKVHLTADKNMTDLAPFIEEKDLPLINFLQKYDAKVKEQGLDIQSIALEDIQNSYELWNNLYRENRYTLETFPIDINVTRVLLPKKEEPFVSHLIFKGLLGHAFCSRSCEEIKLPRSLSEISYVKDLLAKNAYRLKEEKGNEVCYRRYRLIV